MNQPRPVRRVRAFWPMLGVFALLATAWLAGGGGDSREAQARGAGRWLGNGTADLLEAAFTYPLVTLAVLVALGLWWLVRASIASRSQHSG